MDFILIAAGIVLIVAAYFRGRVDELKAHDKSFNIWKDYYEERIENMKNHIKEINNRPENWRDKIAEAKQTFKNQ